MFYMSWAFSYNTLQPFHWIPHCPMPGPNDVDQVLAGFAKLIANGAGASLMSLKGSGMVGGFSYLLWVVFISQFGPGSKYKWIDLYHTNYIVSTLPHRRFLCWLYFLWIQDQLYRRISNKIATTNNDEFVQNNFQSHVFLLDHSTSVRNGWANGPPLLHLPLYWEKENCWLWWAWPVFPQVPQLPDGNLFFGG